MMPDSPNLKKIVVFSSSQKKQLIEGLLSDAAKATSSTISSTMEHALLYGGLAPTNRTAMMWVNMMYTAPNRDVGITMSDCFRFLATKDLRNQLAYSSAFDALLDFFQFHSVPIQMTSDMPKNEMTYCATQLNGIALSLQNEASLLDEKHPVNEYLKNEYLKDAEWLNNESKRITSEFIVGPIREYVAMIRTYSEVLSKYPRPYRLMAWICPYVPWINTQESRYELVCLLKEISKDWD